ncbi:MAG: hypothetical protein AB7O44_28840 [Hyphomicrobiaceae bacterium]
MPRALVVLMAAVCLAWHVASAAAQEPARHALLIGNKSYAAKVGPLKNPHNDVTLVGASLAQKGLIGEACRQNIAQAIGEYAANAKAALDRLKARKARCTPSARTSSMGCATPGTA